MELDEWRKHRWRTGGYGKICLYLAPELSPHNDRIRTKPLLAQSHTARSRHVAASICLDPCRRRLGQDARADHAHGVADSNRAGVTRIDFGGDVHEQSGEGDDHALVLLDSSQHAAYVGWDVSRIV